MFFIMESEGRRIKYNSAAYHWSCSARVRVNVLDYSDWGIETVSWNDLICALQRKELVISDFCNLVKVGEFYKIKSSRIFSKSSHKFLAKGLSLWVDDTGGVLNVEFSDGRCFALSRGISNSCSMVVNYKEEFKLWSTDVDFRFIFDLLPCLDGYKVVLGGGVRAYLTQTCLRLVSSRRTTEFDYISKGELARRTLMLARKG